MQNARLRGIIATLRLQSGQISTIVLRRFGNTKLLIARKSVLDGSRRGTTGAGQMLPAANPGADSEPLGLFNVRLPGSYSWVDQHAGVEKGLRVESALRAS
jgi:hypothetical protein